ncbi:hypothetical protein [Haloplanus aerogenes]|uniref:Uncharacterized protein n=1 Tax=Haloplanus aerogenes TaxID=660522 RepID=A0A3M0DPC7_9EURY|nr:hypothetical protein [Haloplanus aerogenes]AZH24723.1 hypothetical protein DU502_04685 [Haloplanus aerogenes]RMB23617.1 hypothetical protein ATH50_0837 [Haloplanus aerogenes]
MADGDATDDRPSDQLRARAAESRTKLWLYLEADRRLVVTGLVVAVFLVLLAAGLSLPAAAAKLRGGDSIGTLFQGFLTATITGVTLVLTLNQLVLSQELGAVGDQRERMSGALEFREDAADLLDVPVSPARPSQFLRALVQIASRHAQDLRDAVGADHEEVAELTESLIGNADRVAGDLDGAQFGEFDVLSAALNFNYSWKIFAAKRIRETDSLGEDAEAALDRLIDTLELFGPAREHFKTLYFQWELINLSRGILAAAFPALFVAICMIAFFDPAGPISRTFGVVPVVALTSTVSVLPFLVLLVYVLRIATVTKHTLSIGPFILRETEQVEEVTWDDGESR